jgi:hypothetical protein
MKYANRRERVSKRVSFLIREKKNTSRLTLPGQIAVDENLDDVVAEVALCRPEFWRTRTLVDACVDVFNSE